MDAMIPGALWLDRDSGAQFSTPDLIWGDFTKRSSVRDCFLSGGLYRVRGSMRGVITNAHAVAAGIVGTLASRGQYHRGETLEGGGWWINRGGCPGGGGGLSYVRGHWCDDVQRRGLDGGGGYM